MNPIIYAISSILLIAISQFMFKKGVQMIDSPEIANLNLFGKLLKVGLQPSVIGGLLLNGIAAGLWLLALSSLELSFVFPLLSINYILIPLGAYILYQERISKNHKIGLLIICIGIFVISFS